MAETKVKITLFEKTELSKTLEEISSIALEKNFSEEEFCEAVKGINLSFSVENCSRLLSHHICETLDSYTQQSQRYVKMGAEAYVIPEELDTKENAEDPQINLKEEYKKLCEEIFVFYNEMTKLKEGVAGRKAKESDYVEGIKIEDGRYILPLATTTNIFVTLNAEKLSHFFKIIKRHKTMEANSLLKQLQAKKNNSNNNTNANSNTNTTGNAIENGFGENTIKLMEKYSQSSNNFSEKKIQEIYSKELEKINEENNCVFLNAFSEPVIRVGLGASASTNQNAPSAVLEKWGAQKTELSNGITERVLGYGHASISEHARTTFGLLMSLTCYHQFERHRLPSNYRERFENIPIERKVSVPPSIERNEKILAKYLVLIQKAKTLRKKLIEKFGAHIGNYLLLNCDTLKVISSTNARMDCEIMAERTCNNAQWEIRELYSKKLSFLKKTANKIYDKAGPPCTRGICPEGALSCGRVGEMREKYGCFVKGI